MILLPPITREEDLLPAIELLSPGEALVISAAFGRPQNLSAEIVWYEELRTKSGKNKLRCVRRKSDAESLSMSSGPKHASAENLCLCG